MNDVLFDISKQTGAVNIRKIAEQAGIAFDDIRQVFQDKQLRQKLKQDIQAGLDYKLTGTPGFVINETVYMGQIPADVFREHGLSRTGKAK
jgi:protein-disulfide isomerase